MKTHVIVSAIIKNEGKYLIGKRSNSKQFSPNEWEFISGFIDTPESAEETMLREIQEELNTEGIISKAGETYTVTDKETRWIVIPFNVKLKNTKVNANPSDHSELKWVKKEELASIKELKNDFYILNSRKMI